MLRTICATYCLVKCSKSVVTFQIKPVWYNLCLVIFIYYDFIKMNLNFFYGVFLWPLLGVKFFTNCFKTEIIMVTRHCKRCHPLRNAYLGRSFPGIGWKRTYAVSLGSSPTGHGEGGRGFAQLLQRH